MGTNSVQNIVHFCVSVCPVMVHPPFSPDFLFFFFNFLLLFFAASPFYPSYTLPPPRPVLSCLIRLVWHSPYLLNLVFFPGRARSALLPYQDYFILFF